MTFTLTTDTLEQIRVANDRERNRKLQVASEYLSQFRTPASHAAYQQQQQTQESAQFQAMSRVSSPFARGLQRYAPPQPEPGSGGVGGLVRRSFDLFKLTPGVGQVIGGLEAQGRALNELRQGNVGGAIGELNPIPQAIERSVAANPPSALLDLLGRRREHGNLGALFQAGRDTDTATGLPIRTLNTQGSQAITDPLGALREQYNIESRGGIGYGLEPSFLGRQLARVPGIQRNIGPTDISPYDVALGAADVFGDIGTVAGAVRGLRTVTALDVEGAIRSADPTLISREASTEGTVLNDLVMRRGAAVNDLTPIARQAGGAAEDVTDRTGVLLQIPTKEALGPNYTVRDVLQADNVIRQQRTSIANSLISTRKSALEKIGRIDDTGHLLDVDPTDAERALGLAHPSFYDVAERPSLYNLNPDQVEGLAEFGDSIRLVRAERELAGLDPRLIQVEDGGHFIPRSVAETQDVELRPRGGGGTRLGGAKTEASRVFDTAAEAEANGVIYRHPMISADEYTERWLKVSADEHIKQLLIPFSETSSMRVSPALRSQMEGLRAQVQSLRESGIRLSQHEDDAIRGFLEADDPSIDALRDTIDNIRITRGANEGLNLPEATARLDTIRQQIRDLAPEWRDALQRARTPSPGRRTIDLGIAPALSGRDFDEDVAKAITRHYGSGGGFREGSQAGRVFGLLQRTVNTPVRFLNATADVSALLLQQKQLAITHPGTWLTNALRSFRDAVDSRAYDTLIGSPRGRRAASRGLALFGDAGELSEFQSAHWLHQIPGIGNIIRVADNHFVRFNTRMRVDVYDDLVEAISSAKGRTLTALEEEQIARAVNRATGVSASRGGDLEANALFASRFFRSTIESAGMAVADGSLEGQIARRYLRNMVAAAITLSVASAVKDGRDLSEVLNPLDPYALDNGEIRLNSNFLAARVFGHDIKLLGEFDSLARLAVVGADASFRSIRDRDASQLGDAIGYAASTKGSPIVSFVHDLWVGRTFNNENPTSLESLARRTLPFTAQNIIEKRDQNLPLDEVIFGSLLESTGLKAAPLTTSERRDEAVRQFTDEAALKGQYEEPPQSYYELEPVDRVAFDEAHPEFEQQRSLEREQRAEFDDSAKRQIAFDEIDQNRLDRESALSWGIANGTISGRDIRDQYNDIQADAASQREGVLKLAPFDERQPPTDPNERALWDYWEVWSSSKTGTGATDFDAVERKLADLEASWTQDQMDYVDRNTGLTKHAPELQQFIDTRRDLVDSGYFDIRDQIWSRVAPAAGLGEFGNRQQFEQEIVRRFEAQGLDRPDAQIMATKFLEDFPPLKLVSDLANGVEEVWIKANPDLAARALEFGYIDPSNIRDEETLAILGRNRTQP